MRRPDPTFWHGRRVLLTGHTGFKGSWLAAWLTVMGARVLGVSLPGPPTRPSMWTQLDITLDGEFRADIAGRGWQSTASDFDPQIILHLAAQSLVSVGYREPLATFRTNVQGTAELLQFAARRPSLQASLVVTTDKVYDPDLPGNHRESSPLRGVDPYAASKVAAEMVVHSWPHPGHPVATARAGNVIGGGDWAVDRILPDLVRAWRVGSSATLRMPDAVRPWQHVLEPLGGYLLYVEDLVQGRTDAPSLNFGPSGRQVVPVSELVACAADEWTRQDPSASPAWTVATRTDLHESRLLVIDSSRADDLLGWRQTWDWEEAVRRSVRWYVSVNRDAAAWTATLRDIEAYVGEPDG